MKKISFTMIAVVVVFSFIVTSISFAKTFYFNVHNGKKDHNLIKWSRDFSLPAGKKPTSCKVWRWNPDKMKWEEETDKWKCKTTQPKSGSWHVNIEVDTAPAVPKSTWLKFCVDFDTDDVGIGGEDRKYKPKQAHKKSVDKGNPFDADIDNVVFWGGLLGLGIPELGLFVPADTYAYLYQVNNFGIDPLTSFRLENVDSFFGFAELAAPHDGTIETTFLSDLTGEPGTGTPDGIGLATFTGLALNPGISPISWMLDGNAAIATFSGILQGESSNPLVAFSTLAPGMPDNQFNTFLGDGIDEIGNLTWTPTIPEPSTYLLFAVGILAIVGMGYRQRKKAA